MSGGAKCPSLKPLDLLHFRTDGHSGHFPLAGHIARALGLLGVVIVCLSVCPAVFVSGSSLGD
jgi:hypothetical protein